MKRTLTLALAFTLLALAAALPAAAATTWVVDPAHSNVDFVVRHLMANVRGQFTEFDATVVMDPDPAKSSVEFTIQAKSIDTANEQRDTHLRSPDFFDVEKHPTITFRSTEIRRKGENAYEVTGPLTMRGVTQVITLPVSFLGELVDPWGNTKIGFETETRLDRKEYGINWNQALDRGGLLLSDEVRVEIGLQFGVKK
ncbi:MAG: YceI family protein [Thermoanaerobaculia bacterium]|nr:YceI family protein [Thermoanaerobaculia bacterium]